MNIKDLTSETVPFRTCNIKYILYFFIKLYPHTICCFVQKKKTQQHLDQISGSGYKSVVRQR